MQSSLISAVLVAGLTLVLPAVVAAAPGDKETTERISYSDEEPDAPRNEDGEWVEIADPTPAKHGKVYIPVGRGAGQFTRLRIDVEEGRPHVQRVRIDFENGRSRVMKVGVTLQKAKGKQAKRRKHQKTSSAYVDLGGAREIDQVVVMTDRRSRGSYTVHAEAGSGGVASR